MRRPTVLMAWAIWLSLSYAVFVISTVVAAPPGNEHFEHVWARTDQPVADGLVSRTWMWGPEANTDILIEPYSEGPDGEREVQYYDKSRMEITDPAADPSSIWYVTNGLLVVELITGAMQTGHDTFEPFNPAAVNVAGDADDPTGPTYETFGGLLDAPATPAGTTLTARVDRAGVVSDDQDPGLALYGAVAEHLDDVTNHTIASPFWAFMNSTGLIWEDGATVEAQLFENPFFATGRPITEAYWAHVKVANVYRDVLLQCFERRCLTFDPTNDPEWRTEAGNVGQHYYGWRYEQAVGPLVGDYGDAPDGGPTGYPTQFPQTGQFPTLFASGGAHTIDLSQATLGATASAELDANDPNDPDGVMNLTNADSDDGLVGLTTVLTQIPPPAVLEVQVVGGSGGDFFLNVLIDLDMDGTWGGTAGGGEPEWVVQNHPVSIGAGETDVVTPPAFAFANGNRLPDGAWMRVALTSEQVVSNDWDGSGSFAAGEIEDHVIGLPTFEDSDKRLPVVVPDCGGPYKFAPGQQQIIFNCTVENMVDTAGSFTWVMNGPLTGNVQVAPLAGGPTPIGAGPGAVVNVGPFVATRGDDLPSTWRFVVTAVDPPSVVHAGGVILGFPDSEVTVEFTDVLEPEKAVDQQQVEPGNWLTYSIAMPANPELDGPSEGQIIDPINAEFIPDMEGPLIEGPTCNIGECFYDDTDNNVEWVGELMPGDVVHMSFMIYVPEVLFVDELTNCVQGFDGVAEFSDVCVSTEVVHPEMARLE